MIPFLVKKTIKMAIKEAFVSKLEF